MRCTHNPGCAAPTIPGALRAARRSGATTLSHYSLDGAKHYAAHHDTSLRTRITTWRERALLATALRHIGGAESVLDVPCGTGRFWPVLFGSGAQEIIAADNSDGMLEVARAAWPGWADRLRLLNTSIFALDLPDGAVDVVSCMRFMHHLALPEDRARALSELRRVCRRYVIASLWVDGNLQSGRRLRHDARHPPTAGYGPRRCLPRAAFERECAAAGLAIETWFDVAPGWSMWRFYVLRKT